MTTTLWALLIVASPIQIQDTTGTCIPQGTDTALEAVLQSAHEKPTSLTVSIVATVQDEETGDPIDVAVEILEPGGEVLLTRNYVVAKVDCASVDRLLVLVVQRALESLPLEQWIVFEDPPDPPPTQIDTYGFVSVGPRGLPVGAEIQAGGARSFEPGSPWFLTFALRAGQPHALGGGYVQDMSGLFGISRAFELGSWESQIGVRAGGILLTGFGFDSNQRAILPWAEAAWCIGKEYRGLWLGAEVAASPIAHHVRTEGTDANQTLALVRVSAVTRFGGKK